MSYKTVYYTPYNIECYSDKSFKPIIRQTELIDKTYTYTNCPVFNHQSNRTFVLLSPIDFSFSIKRVKYTINSTNAKIYANIKVDNSDQSDLLQYNSQHLNSTLPVFQMKVPKFLFWTYDDDVWFNFLDHPMTSYSNNLIAVSGWFNLSNWTRTSSFAFTMVDEDKPVVIKKGDPICRLSFIYPNLNEGIVLKEEKDPEKIAKVEDLYFKKRERMHHTTGTYSDGSLIDESDLPEVKNEENWKSKIFSKTNSKNKCPVGFLFK